MGLIIDSGRLLRLLLAVMIGITAATISAKAVGQYAPVQSTEPFSAFADLFPGQPESAINAYPMVCWTGHTNASGTEKGCSLSQETGAISNVDLGLDHGVIVQVTFTLRDGSVQVGDLSTWLQNNPMQSYPRLMYFTFHELNMVAKVGDHHPHASPYAPVYSVTLSARS